MSCITYRYINLTSWEIVKWYNFVFVQKPWIYPSADLSVWFLLVWFLLLTIILCIELSHWGFHLLTENFIHGYVFIISHSTYFKCSYSMPHTHFLPSFLASFLLSLSLLRMPACVCVCVHVYWCACVSIRVCVCACECVCVWWGEERHPLLMGNFSGNFSIFWWLLKFIFFYKTHFNSLAHFVSIGCLSLSFKYCLHPTGKGLSYNNLTIPSLQCGFWTHVHLFGSI